MNRPVFPKYLNEDKRKRSFHNWPLITVTPRELSRCGFFYTGRRDSVVCFHCGRKLEGWLVDDVPLAAHLKYFPDCEYVQKLRIDSQTFAPASNHVVDSQTFASVSNHVVDSQTFAPASNHVVDSQTFASASNYVVDSQTVASSSTHVVDHKEKKKVVRSATSDDDARLAKDVVKQASRIFPKSVVYAVATEHWLKEGSHVTSLHKLCHAILNSSVYLAREKDGVPSASSPPRTTDSDEKLACKVCFERDVGVVLLPCHHQVVCEHCVELLATCPICRCNVDEIMKVFWA